MAKLPNALLGFAMRRRQAEKAGLVRCTCGHSAEAHRDSGKNPCVTCACREYTEYSRHTLVIGRVHIPAPVKRPLRRRRF
jgi:hypothetical protein